MRSLRQAATEDDIKEMIHNVDIDGKQQRMRAVRTSSCRRVSITLREARGDRVSVVTSNSLTHAVILSVGVMTFRSSAHAFLWRTINREYFLCVRSAYHHDVILVLSVVAHLDVHVYVSLSSFLCCNDSLCFDLRPPRPAFVHCFSLRVAFTDWFIVTFTSSRWLHVCVKLTVCYASTRHSRPSRP